MNYDFWSFSLQFYQRPEVAKACLELQDRDGADVNLILFALWAASRGHRLDASAIAGAEHTVRQWRETVTQQLRAARRAMKARHDAFDVAAVEALRQQVLAAELEAERLQQNAMAIRLNDDAGHASQSAARQNLSEYEVVLGRPIGSASVAILLDVFAQFG